MVLLDTITQYLKETMFGEKVVCGVITLNIHRLNHTKFTIQNDMISLGRNVLVATLSFPQQNEFLPLSLSSAITSKKQDIMTIWKRIELELKKIPSLKYVVAVDFDKVFDEISNIEGLNVAFSTSHLIPCLEKFVRSEDLYSKNYERTFFCHDLVEKMWNVFESENLHTTLFSIAKVLETKTTDYKDDEHSPQHVKHTAKFLRNVAR